MTCSVEKPEKQRGEQHDVQRQNHEEHLSLLVPIGSGAKGGTEKAFEHAVYRFYLPPLPVSSQVKP